MLATIRTTPHTHEDEHAAHGGWRRVLPQMPALVIGTGFFALFDTLALSLLPLFAMAHGIPGARILQPGDILSVDSGAIQEGWNGDAARTFVLPDPAHPERVAERQKLSEVTEQSLWHGIARLATARHLNEVGEAIEDHILSQGDYGILTDYIGHGIGRRMHEEPPVFNYRVRSKGPEVRPGLVVAIEPMVVRGDQDTYVKDDGWTVATEDGSAAAHWEHSVAVHAGGIWVLTAVDGGAAGLAPFGITPTPIP